MRNVIFDLGGVVLEWNPDAILEGYYADPGARERLKAALFQHPDWVQMDKGTLGEPEVVERVAQRTGIATGELAGLMEAVRKSLQPKADTLLLLKDLAGRQVPLYCLSNMPASTFAHLRGRYDFWSAFRGIVISGEIKMMKPEREIFEHLLSRYALSASETVFVDDHAPNIEAARRLGLHTVLFKDAEQCRIDLERLLAG
ncbi:MAG: HAD family phosphatase [Steroidobacteraceae bacterium]